jgi:ParB/RepB/Spo0J family partition protein
MTTETFAHLPLAAIVTSLTNPRKTLDHVKLTELAESIRTSGVHQPVLVRPLPASRVADTSGMSPRPTFELVSGERRYRASEMADLSTIPAMVRALTDDQVLEIQLVENLQRDDLQPLEEAEGYDLLMHRPETDGHAALTVDQVAAKIGKSRSYVYARLALLRLGTDGREALRKGQITAAHALLIARIPSTTVQAQALGNIVNPMTGDLIGVREAGALIQRQYMLRLAEAEFSLEDVDLVPNAGACNSCPKHTGADPDLFADIPGKYVCTDTPCFKAKAAAHQERKLKAARDRGATVIEGREAQALISPTADNRLEGYLRLDDPRDAPAGSKSLRAVIGDLLDAEGIQATIIELPGGFASVIETETAQRLLALKAQQDQAAALKAKASTTGKEAEKAAQELQQQKDTDRFENAWRWRVLTEAWKKINAADEGMYSLPVGAIRMLARERVPKHPKQAARLADFLCLGKVAPAQALADWINDHDDPDRALALLMLFEAATNWQQAADLVPVRLIVIAEDCGVDVDVEMVKAEVQAEHRAEIAARKAPEPSLPLPSAAQADRGAGGGSKAKGTKGKGKNAPAAPAAPKTSEAEARTGIAAAMQGNEAGAGCGPEGADPAGCAGGDDGRATSPDAGASPTVPGGA